MQHNLNRYMRIEDNLYVALKQRVASNSCKTAWLQSKKPRLLDSDRVNLPNGITWEQYLGRIIHDQPHKLKKDMPEGITILQLFRDPVDRFRSICAKRISDGHFADAESVLVAVETEKLSVTDAVDQTASLITGCITKLYRYDVDFDQYIVDAGFEPETFPSVNKSLVEVVLTADQQARVEAVYAEDVALYNSITEAGQVHVKPPSEAEQQAAAIQAAYDAAASAFYELPEGRQIFWEPTRKAVANAILAGEISRAREIIADTPAPDAQAEVERSTFLGLLPSS
ncbi:hypothetical protein N9955_00030 [bacterium]|nr:hypothetical protein [bacterium]